MRGLVAADFGPPYNLYMRRRGAMRDFSLWLAIVAMLAGALAPTVSYALARDAAGWSPVCTSLGSAWIRTDQSGPVKRVPEPVPSHTFEHCPYCSLHAANLGMPPSAPVLAALPLTYAPHWRYVALAPTLRIWSDALSRGPPLAS